MSSDREEKSLHLTQPLGLILKKATAPSPQEFSDPTLHGLRVQSKPYISEEGEAQFYGSIIY